MTKTKYECSKCKKTLNGKRSALKHARSYHKSNDPKEFIELEMEKQSVGCCC